MNGFKFLNENISNQPKLVAPLSFEKYTLDCV